MSEHDKSLIITTLTSDETKKELLDKISSDIEKLLIISSLGFEDQQKYFEEIDKKNGNLKKIKDIYKIGYKEILELFFLHLIKNYLKELLKMMKNLQNS